MAASKLNNGAVIVAQTRVSDIERIVLATWDRGDGAAEYVTWSVSNDGDAYSGHYFDSIEAGAADYAERAGSRAKGSV